MLSEGPISLGSAQWGESVFGKNAKRLPAVCAEPLD